MKKNIVISGIVIIALLVIGAVAIAQNKSDRPDAKKFELSKTGKAVKIAQQIDKPDKAALKINGSPISRKVYAKFEAFMKTANENEGKPAPSKKEIIKNIAKEELLLQEAERLGITVTEQEVDQQIERQREEFKGASAENQQMLRGFYEAQGIDFDNHWESKEARETSKIRMLANKMISDKLSQAKTPDERHNVYQEMTKRLDDLYEKAKIEELDMP